MHYEVFNYSEDDDVDYYYKLVIMSKSMVSEIRFQDYEFMDFLNYLNKFGKKEASEE